MAETVNREHLVEQVTQLATEHAELVALVRRVLEVPLPCDASSTAVDVHLTAADLDALRRLTGSP